MGYSCGQATGWTTSYVTISLTVDFVGSANIGQWLAIESDVIKTGSTICFAQSLIKPTASRSRAPAARSAWCRRSRR